MTPIVYPQKSIAIIDSSSIGEARRFSSRMGETARLKQADLDRVPLIVTELATNLIQHAQNGEILIRVLPIEAGPGVEIIAIDRGPGIADLPRCMADGYSSRGTRGCGLGAVRRLSTEFDIHSTRPAGTVVLSRVRSGDEKSRAERQFSAISVPAPGETECGDAWDLRWTDERLSALVVDGLGHGPLAAAAAAQAVRVFGERAFDSPASYLETAHSALRSSRGAALAIAEVDLRTRKLHYAAVGNIAASVVGPSGKSQALMSHSGIIGVEVRKMRQFDYEWDDGALLIMHSDGLSARWKLDDYPGLARADAGIIAATLYRDGKRERDDATILVARLKAS
jgi:anti-sigma regulatory factor (Ser/Thr protein kinase)